MFDIKMLKFEEKNFEPGYQMGVTPKKPGIKIAQPDFHFTVTGKKNQ